MITDYLGYVIFHFSQINSLQFTVNIHYAGMYQYCSPPRDFHVLTYVGSIPDDSASLYVLISHSN